MPEMGREDRRVFIIFFNDRNVVDEMKGTVLEGTPDRITAILELFNKKEISALWVPRWLMSGWKTELTQQDCVVLFAGPNWTYSELAQGASRLSPYRTR